MIYNWHASDACGDKVEQRDVIPEQYSIHSTAIITAGRQCAVPAE